MQKRWVSWPRFVKSRSAGSPFLVMHTWCLPVWVGYDSRASSPLANRISCEHFFNIHHFCAGNSVCIHATWQIQEHPRLRAPCPFVIRVYCTILSRTPFFLACSLFLARARLLSRDLSLTHAHVRARSLALSHARSVSYFSTYTYVHTIYLNLACMRTPCSLSLSFSLLHTYTHSFLYLFFPLSFSFPLSLLFLSLFPFLTLFLSHPRSISPPFTCTHPLSLCLSLSIPVSVSCYVARTCARSLPPSHPLPLLPSRAQTCTQKPSLSRSLFQLL